jgi:regulator of PEP synthase PpsR (kinase-PPPase family)
MRRTSKSKPLRTIYILSDSTGNLARHMLSAFLTQFPRDTFTLVWRPFLRDSEEFERIMDEVVEHPGILFHAFVLPAAKATVEARCRDAGVPCCDLTGPFVEFLAEASGLKPQDSQDRLHETDAHYRQRISAIEYTLAHDDGLALDTLHEAQVILAGVSRTSKSPTSIYLAQLGYKVANVSLAIEVPPPEELLAADPTKVVGLLIDPRQLVEIRTHRKAGWKLSTGDYNDVEHVSEELRWARRLFTRQGWHTLDVTDQAIEETAAKVASIVGLGF